MSKQKIPTMADNGRKSGRAVFAKAPHQVNSVTPARNPTVLKRILRRLSG